MVEKQLETKTRQSAISAKVILLSPLPNMDVMFYCAKGNAAKVLNLQSGDNILLTGGPINGQSGNTNTIKVETI